MTSVKSQRISWSEFKQLLSKTSQPFKEVNLRDVSVKLILNDGGSEFFCIIHTDGDMPDEWTEYQTYYQSNANETSQPRSNNNLPTVSINRVPFGNTITPLGDSDDLVTGAYGSGVDIFLDPSNKIRDFALLNNFYAIGGEASWGKDSSNRDYINATLIAPATIGNNVSGDFIKQEVEPSSGLHLFAPSIGSGDWDLNLTDSVHDGVDLLHVTPVPVAGNNGHFDYDKVTKRMVVNSNQTGGYNLYDFPISLITLGRKMWAVDGGGVRSFVTEDVVGKLFYANWIIRFELFVYNSISRTSSDISVGVNLIPALLKNL